MIRALGAETSPQIINRMISEDDEELLKSFARDLRWRTAIVSSLQRFGFSNAFLYVLRNAEGAGDPRVVKIGPARQMRDERMAWKSIEGFFPDAGDVRYQIHSPSKRAGLCFRLRPAGRDTTEVLELDVFYTRALSGDSTAAADCRQFLEQTYSSLRNAHLRLQTPVTRTYGSAFRRYIRSGVSPNRVEQLFTYRPETVEICGFHIAGNPLRPLRQLLKRETSGYDVFAIHGDMHLSNIVISEGAPRLIDFAWAGIDDHVMKDYVLMESSIRFMRFPRHVHPKIVLQIDSELNRNWSVDSARSVIPPRLTGRKMLEFMLSVVETVRSSLEKALQRRQPIPGDWTSEYFRCLYLVLAGQQRFTTFPLVRSIVNLDQLSRYAVEDSRR
jgi:hypothetical protein